MDTVESDARRRWQQFIYRLNLVKDGDCAGMPTDSTQTVPFTLGEALAARVMLASSHWTATPHQQALIDGFSAQAKELPQAGGDIVMSNEMAIAVVRVLAPVFITLPEAFGEHDLSAEIFNNGGQLVLAAVLGAFSELFDRVLAPAN